MTPEAYEQGNRRAEIMGNEIVFMLVTGNVRRSKHGVWRLAVDDIKRARRLARRWVRRGKLGEPVLH